MLVTFERFAGVVSEVQPLYIFEHPRLSMLVTFERSSGVDNEVQQLYIT